MKRYLKPAEDSQQPALLAGNNTIEFPRPADKSLGAILIDRGKLSAADAEAVLRLQAEKGMRFGDAAIKLGLVSKADVQQALSTQFEYPYLSLSDDSVSSEVVSAFDPFGRQTEAFRALRTQLLLRWQDKAAGENVICIVSAAPREGRTFVVANLAVVFSQLGERTLVIDADLRTPRLQAVFGLSNQVGLTGLLMGKSELVETAQRVPGLLDLHVVTSGPLPPNPQEILSRPRFAHLLEEASSHFDVVLVDTTAASAGSDCYLVGARTGAALVVMQKDATRMSAVQELVRRLGESNCRTVGATINER